MNGFKLEHLFTKELSNIKYCELNPKWKKHIKRMFPDVNPRDYIKCVNHYDRYAKPDVIIQVRHHTKMLSIKNGRNPTMHCESFSHFYKFLKSLGIDDDSLAIITLYHFGDCRKYGPFSPPLTKQEIVDKFGDKIEETNRKLNKPEIIKAVIYRSVVQGAREERTPISYLYYGNFEKGLLISPEELTTSILSNTEIHRDFIHFGQLVYQPGQRDRGSLDFLNTTIHWPILTRYFYICKDEDNILGDKAEGNEVPLKEKVTN